MVFLFSGLPFRIVKRIAESLEGGASLKPMCLSNGSSTVPEFCKVNFLKMSLAFP